MKKLNPWKWPRHLNMRSGCPLALWMVSTHLAACQAAPEVAIAVKSAAVPLPMNGTLNQSTTGTETHELTSANAWAFDPARDTFKVDAVLDLRGLNEKVAGEKGFVRLSADGNDFMLGDGNPARFWSVTTTAQRSPGAEPLEHHARWLAKRGVNMVRFHGQISPKAGTPLNQPNRDEIDQCWRLVAAMKKQGIYTTISPYWAFGFNKSLLTGWGIEGDADQTPAGLLFFDPKLQEAYKAWARVLFGEKNPHTGTRLADDPAVALIQLQNEDSLLFWTTQNIKGKQLDNLRQLFGDFLKKKYGSLNQAAAAWGQTDAPADNFQNNQGDDFAGGKAGLYLVYQWTLPTEKQGSTPRGKRLADQLQFFGETMFNFNRSMAAFYRKELGCKQLINAGNWTTADTVQLGDVERWSYGANDVVAVNKYFGGVHNGPRNGWAMDVGDTFTNVSALLDPFPLPTNLKQVAGHPTVISESHWVTPTLYQSEGPFLTAAYQSLTGVDSFYWFSLGDGDEWQQPSPWGGKWAIGTPMELGQFPAAALMFRRGDIRKGRPVVHEERTLSQLWNRDAPLVAESKGYIDPNRDTGDQSANESLRRKLDPLVFLVGPVEVKYGGDPNKNTMTDLSKFIDNSRKTVRSVTGEITLNHGIGFCTLNTPRAQGATGFLKKAGVLKLADVTLSSNNDYASVLAVALDNLPLRTSKRILVQVGTTARPTGWQDQNASFQSSDGKRSVQGQRIVNAGKAPWLVANTDVTLTLRNTGLRRATSLNINGERVQEVGAIRQGDTLRVMLPPNTLYLVLD